MSVDGKLQVEAGHGGRGADDAGGRLDVLTAHRIGDVACGKTALGGLLRVDPDAHRIVAAAEDLHLADAVDAGQPILDVQHTVVAQIVDVILPVRRDQVHDQRQVWRALDGGDAEAAHFLRQPRLGLRDAVLHELLGLIGIGAEFEGDRQSHQAVGGRLALHVEHAFDAVDLFFERCRHRLGDNGWVGARILRAHDDLRRHDFGIFGDRQTGHADQAGHEDQDRKNAREDRAVDEEA
ncbi:hypothetical protein D9M72_410960 [compost metagenome]